MDDHSHVHFPRKQLRRFIEMYRDNSCLWDRESPDYRIKMKKQAALGKLTKLAQEFDSDATRVHVLRKIDSLRACVRREYKRVIESRLNATCEEDIYKPNLWYFNLFSFVFDDPSVCSVQAQNVVKNKVSEEEVASDQDDSYPGYEMPLAEVEVPDSESHTSTKKHHITVLDEDPFKVKRSKSSTEVDDEYDAIGINVAAKLRHLPPNMRILAEKLVNDVLFQAQLNGLNSSSMIITTDPIV